MSYRRIRPVKGEPRVPISVPEAPFFMDASYRVGRGVRKVLEKVHWTEESPSSARGGRGLRGGTDGKPVSKGSTRASSGLSGVAGVALLPPRLQPLSTDERAEAVALLSDLFLAAARRARDSRDVATADRELRKEGLAA